MKQQAIQHAPKLATRGMVKPTLASRRMISKVSHAVLFACVPTAYLVFAHFAA